MKQPLAKTTGQSLENASKPAEVGARRTARGIRIRYAVGLSAIALLVTASFFSMQRIISEQRTFANLVSIAGHQAGLVNRIAYFCNVMITTSDLAEFEMAQAQVGRTINRIETSQRILTRGDPDQGIPHLTSETLRLIYHDPMMGLKSALNRFLENARVVYASKMGALYTGSLPYLYLTTYGPHALEPLLDAVVEEYERIGREAILQIEGLERLIWLATLVVLALEAALIFWPMEQRIHQTISTLDRTITKLSQTRGRLMTAQRIALVGDWRLELVNRKLSWSNQVYEICGLNRQEFRLSLAIARRCIHPDDRSRIRNNLLRAIRSGANTSIEFRVVRPSGEERIVQQRSEITCLSDGRLELIGTVQDVTELRQTKTLLEQSDMKYRALFEQSSEGLYLHDLEGRILEVNRTACQQSGRTRNELTSMTVFDLLPDQSRRQDILKRWSQWPSGQRFTVKDQHRHKDGSLYPVEITTGPVSYDSQQLMLAGVRDLSDYHKGQAERARLEQQLSQAQKLEAVGRLAGGVAHDYNNMLSVIIGYSELGLHQNPENQEMRDCFEQIHAAAGRSMEITRQLLAFARKQTIAPKILNLNQTVEAMLKILQRLIGEDIQLFWQPGENLWPIRIDPSQVDQILANLCINARDAISGTGTITISSENHQLRASRISPELPPFTSRYVKLTVEDDGCGMDEQVSTNIFEPFFSTKGSDGTGLGLATVYGIVKQNDGHISVSSSPGQGSRFELYFPQHSMPVKNLSLDRESSIPEGNGETVLLVEDEPAITRVIQQLLVELN